MKIPGIWKIINPLVEKNLREEVDKRLERSKTNIKYYDNLSDTDNKAFSKEKVNYKVF